MFISYTYISVALEGILNFVKQTVAQRKHIGAFYAMLPNRIDSSIRLWTKELPTISPYYAVKCNPDPHFLNYLFDRGINFDCASERELLQIKHLSRGPVSNRIVYANPCKSVRDICAAKAIGSPMTIVDSVEEVEKLTSYGGKALIRLAVDDTGSDMPFSSKFGAHTENIREIAAMAYDKGVELKGFSFHVGSCSKDYMAYSKAIEYCKRHMPILLNEGHYPTILDIGGGFLPDDDDFVKKAYQIRSTLRNLPRSVSVIAEPGRFFAANSFDFFVEVIGKKYSNGQWKYTLDDSIYGQFSNILFDKGRPLWERVRENGEPCRAYSKGTLFGRTCDSLDVIAIAESMEELRVGDWLRFPRMGAYTRATASEFNGFPTPDVIVLTAEECNAYDRGATITHTKGVGYPSPLSPVQRNC